MEFNNPKKRKRENIDTLYYDEYDYEATCDDDPEKKRIHLMSSSSPSLCHLSPSSLPPSHSNQHHHIISSSTTATMTTTTTAASVSNNEAAILTSPFSQRMSAIDDNLEFLAKLTRDLEEHNRRREAHVSSKRKLQYPTTP